MGGDGGSGARASSSGLCGLCCGLTGRRVPPTPIPDVSDHLTGALKPAETEAFLDLGCGG